MPLRSVLMRLSRHADNWHTGDGRRDTPALASLVIAFGMLPLSRATAAARPDLSRVDTPAIREALSDPDKLWNFLTSPETPYEQRRAAAWKAGQSVPMEMVPKIVRTREQLQREDLSHRWGMEPDRMSAGPAPTAAGKPPTRHFVLGHEWVPADHPVPYPQTWEDEARAPWPWQVEQALGDLLNRAAYFATPDRARAWFRACLGMPCDSNEQAATFLDATTALSWSRGGSLAVMERWRQIALDRRFPGAAARVPTAVGTAAGAWDDDRAADAGQVILLDVLRSSPHSEAREGAAYNLPALRRQMRHVGFDYKDVNTPEPTSALLAAAQKACDPATGDDWRRLYVYAFSACEAMDKPPIEVDRRADPASPKAKALLKEFEDWFAANRGEWEAKSAAERDRLDQTRRHLTEALHDASGK